MTRVWKAVLFAAVFWAVCAVLGFFLRPDVDTYTRAVMRELHSGRHIDVLVCGASHVSHLIDAVAFKERANGQTIMCSGTPNQAMDGTAVLLQETLSRHSEITHVWVECDFAAADGDVPLFKREPGKAFFLVQHYLADPMLKLRYTLHAISPAYYLNCLLPIGKESLLDLNPMQTIRTAKVKLSPVYWSGDWRPVIKDAEYAPGGTVIDHTFLDAGGISSGIVKPIAVGQIGQTWKGAVADIVQSCKEHGVGLTFFSAPSTDYYLTEKGNYDEYASFVRKYITSLGYEYYDFSFLRPDVCEFVAEDFFDDNHLNKNGIPKFTRLFADFVSGKVDRGGAFYSSFAEKKEKQPPRVYGLVLDEAKDKKSVAIYPVMNRDDDGAVTYTVTILVVAKQEKRAEDGGDAVSLPTEVVPPPQVMPWLPAGVRVVYPPRTSGKITIDYYLGDEKQGSVTEHYTAL